MFGVGGVTVSEVGVDILTVTVRLLVVVFPATSVPTTATVLDAEKSGTVHEKELPVTDAVAPPHVTPLTPDSESLTVPAIAI